MTLKQRRILFYSLIAVFLGLGTGAVLYAQGWRLNFGTLELGKVGGIYVRSFPTNTAIKLNGKPTDNKSGILSPGTLINDLFPRTYALELTVPHFRPWQAHLAVKPSLVTEIKYAVLLPEQAALVVPGPLIDFRFLGSQPIIQNASRTLLYQGQTVPGNTILGFADNNRVVLTQGGAIYYWYATDNATSTNLSALFRKVGLRAAPAQVTLDPMNESQVLVEYPKGLALVDVARASLTTLATSSTSTVIEAPGISDFWISWSVYDPKEGVAKIFLYDKVLGTTREMSRALPGHTLKLKWARNGLLGIVQSDGQTYTYALGADTLTQIARDGRDLEFSPNGNYLAVLEHDSLEIFSLVDSDYWRFNPKNIAAANGLIWYQDNHNLFIKFPDHVGFLGLEDKAMENYAEVVVANKYDYDPDSNRLYFLKDGGIYSLTFPK